MNLPRTKAAAAAVVLASAGVIGVVTAAPADALPGRVCQTHHEFFDALAPVTQRHLYRGSGDKWGIRDVRCAHGWAAALATVKGKHGKAGYGFTVNEHRNDRGVWHEIDRTKPCAHHKIPKKIYVQFCESN